MRSIRKKTKAWFFYISYYWNMHKISHTIYIILEWLADRNYRIFPFWTFLQVFSNTTLSFKISYQENHYLDNVDPKSKISIILTSKNNWFLLYCKHIHLLHTLLDNQPSQNVLESLRITLLSSYRLKCVKFCSHSWSDALLPMKLQLLQSTHEYLSAYLYFLN